MDGSGNYDIRKFDLDVIRRVRPGQGKLIGIIGGRGSGKSLLAKDIMYHLRKVPVGVVMSGTEDGNGYYSEFVPSLFVYNTFRADVLKGILDKQMKLKRQGRTREVFVVLDDLMFNSEKVMKEDIIKELWMNGRHSGITIIVIAQFATDLGPPKLRGQIDYVFAFREPAVLDRKRLYEMYFGILPNFQEFNKVMQACTENFECLVMDKITKSNNPLDVLFWYKAAQHPPFRMGHKHFWRFHSKKYKRPDEDDDEPKPKFGIRKLQ